MSKYGKSAQENYEKKTMVKKMKSFKPAAGFLPLLACLLVLATKVSAEITMLAAWQELDVAAFPSGNGDQKAASFAVPGRSSLAASSMDRDGNAANATASHRVTIHGNSFECVGNFGLTLVKSGTGWSMGRFVFELDITDDKDAFIVDLTEHTYQNSEVPTNLNCFVQHLRLLNGDWRSMGGWSLGLENNPSEVVLGKGRHRISFGSPLLQNSRPTNWGLTNLSYGLQYTAWIRFGAVQTAPGAFQSNPVLPDDNNTFTNVSSRRWMDPPLASGFRFEGKEGTTFDEIMAFPQGFGSNFHVYIAGEKVGERAGGESFDLVAAAGAPVIAFEIRNITPFVDGSSPVAFPVMLKFAQELGTFTMLPIAAPTIEASTGPDGSISVHFQGVLQSTSDLGNEPWKDVVPGPATPFVIKKENLTQGKMFFRSRERRTAE